MYISLSIGIEPVSFEMDFDGDGIVDYSGSTFEGVSHTYSTEGIYTATVTVTDAAGNGYSDSITIVVLPRQEIDTLLRQKWERMKEALGRGDIQRALNYLTSNRRVLYGYNFELMKSVLSTVVQEMGDIVMKSASGRVAEYEMHTVVEGVEYNFYIKFVKDLDGVWRIYFF